MTRFALKTLFSDRGKLLAAVVGVVFSLVLVNIQGGLYFGLMERASLLINIAGRGHLGRTPLGGKCGFGQRDSTNANCPHQRHAGHPKTFNPTSWARAWPRFPTEAMKTCGSLAAIPIPGWGHQIASRAHWRISRKAIASAWTSWTARNSVMRKWATSSKSMGTARKSLPRPQGLLGFMTTPNLFTTLPAARRYAEISPTPIATISL